MLRKEGIQGQSGLGNSGFDKAQEKPLLQCTPVWGSTATCAVAMSPVIERGDSSMQKLVPFLTKGFFF